MLNHKVKIFGSELWAGCEPAKEYLLQKGIKDIEYLDITKSLKDLKNFLKIRDTSPMYAGVRKIGRVGIPLIIFNDEEMILGLDKDKIDELLSK